MLLDAPEQRALHLCDIVFASLAGAVEIDHERVGLALFYVLGLDEAERQLNVALLKDIARRAAVLHIRSRVGVDALMEHVGAGIHRKSVDDKNKNRGKEA